MFNSVEYVRGVCADRKIPVSQLEKDCGFANGYMNPKKLQKIPYDRAKVISEYLGVSLEYLLNGPDTSPSSLSERNRRDIARDLERLMDDLDSAGDLQFDGDPMSDEARESMKAAMKLGLEAAKIKNKERFTPKNHRRG